MNKLLGKNVVFLVVFKIAFAFVEVDLDVGPYCNSFGECENITSNPNGKFVFDGGGHFRFGRKLHFTKCNVPYFPSKVFELFKSVTDADFSNSNIKFLTKGDFIGAKYVNKLFLKNNQIEDLVPDLFEPMTDIQKIDISGNLITHLFDNSFVRRSLRILVANNNQIEYVESNVGGKDLEEIYLNGNKIKKLKNFGYAYNLHLNVIDLSNNPLIELDSVTSIELLINNTTLSSYKCNSERLHANFCKLQSISFGTDVKTTELYLSNNLLSDISNITKVSSVFILDISRNPIKYHKTRIFENMYFLEYLNLSSTDVSRLEYDTFWNMTNIYTLDLSHNNLDNFDADRLYPLKSLKKLYLHGNNLGILYYDDFRPYNSEQFTEIGLTGNNWGCYNLRRMIQYFVNRDIKIHFPTNYQLDKSENVAGIGCNTL